MKAQLHSVIGAFLLVLAVVTYLATRSLLETIIPVLLVGAGMLWVGGKVFSEEGNSAPRSTNVHIVRGKVPPHHIQKYVEAKEVQDGLWYATPQTSTEYLLRTTDGIGFYCEKPLFLPFHTPLKIEYSSPQPNTFFVDIVCSPKDLPELSERNLKDIYALYGGKLPIFAELSQQSMSYVRSFAREAGIEYKEVPYQPV